MKLFKVNARPGRVASRALPLLPFIICIIAYSLTSYIRHYGIIPDWVSSIGSVLLFSTEKLQQLSVESKYQIDLDNGNVSDDLRQEFESNEISLQDASVSIKEKDSKWLITDDGKQYYVRKEKDELKIYSDDFLRQELEKIKRSLSQNATVSTRIKGSRWRIIDEDSKQTYSVRKEEGKLNIYRNAMPYWIARIAGNPQDKMVPTVRQLGDGFHRSAFEKYRDEYRLYVDTKASVRRFLISFVLLFLGVVFGLHMGMLPYTESLFYRFFLFIDKIPALAVLPILFIVFGVGELSKIALILIGVMPTIILDTYLRAKATPREQVTKAMTLKASNFEIMYRIVLPKIFPKVLDTIRLNLKAVFLFLIAGEALAATAGLGYRIFLVRRYIAMDIIIPYVIWISLLAFLADLAMRVFIKKLYPWLDK